MDKKALTKMSKMFIVSQIVLLIGAFVFILFYTPSLDYPGNNEILDKNVVDFKFRNANVILIDDNPDFSSPMVVNSSEMDAVRFSPGTYYWKAVGVIESSSNKFIVNSLVGLELDSENSTLKNVGDVTLNVTVKNQSGLSGLAILDVDVEYPVDAENKTIYRGEQYDK